MDKPNFSSPQGDARQLLASLDVPRPLDFLFIDATKAQSDEYLDAVWAKLAPECLIVTDNTSTHAQELSTFVGRLRSLPAFASCEVSIGNGVKLTVRRRDRAD